MESWTHVGRTANIIIKDIIHIFASISKTMRILLMGRRNRERWYMQRCQHSIFKMLNDFEPQSEKCLISDEMVNTFPIFCLISPIFFAYIKQRWRFQELKWVTIKQNELWLACLYMYPITAIKQRNFETDLVATWLHSYQFSVHYLLPCGDGFT